MQNPPFFWNSFSKNNRSIYLFSLIVLGVGLLSLLFFYANGLENIISWNVLSELFDQPFILEKQNIDGFDYEIPARAYFVNEQFVASGMALNVYASALFVVLAALGIGLGTAAVSQFKTLWYYIAMIGVAAALATMRFELLCNLTGNYLSVAVVMSVFVLSYYFHAFRPQVSLWHRFMSFAALVFVILLAIWQYSGAKASTMVMHLAAYRLPVALLLSIFFIFWTSVEIPHLLLKLACSANKPLINFLIITFFFVGNILLVHLRNQSLIDWNIIYLSPILVLIVATLVGLWGFRERAGLFAQIADFEASGAVFYVALGIITLATTGFAYATANDPLTEVIDDAVTYSNLATGIIFLVYVVVNFMPLFRQNLDVSKVVFKPLQVPFGTVRVGAAIVVIALLAQRNFFQLNQAMAGYYASLGDLAVSQNELQYAEIQYKNALGFEGRHHKTNYALATLANLQGDNATAGVYFSQALQKVPSEYAYAGLSRCLNQEGEFFRSLFVLKEGSEKFPKSVELFNNLGYAYQKALSFDSSRIFYQKALSISPQNSVVKANMLALGIKNIKDSEQTDLLLGELRSTAGKANALALSLLKNQKIDELFELTLGKDSAISVGDFGYLSNWVLAKKDKANNLATLMKSLEQNQNNEQFFGEIQFARAANEYYVGNKLNAFELLDSRIAIDSMNATNPFRKAALLWKNREKSIRVKLPNCETLTDCENSLARNPFNIAILSNFVASCNAQKQANKANAWLVRIRRFAPENPQVLQLYVDQCLEMRLLSAAQEGLEQLKKLSLPTYEAYLPAYKAKLTQIEKTMAEF
jgi:Flp pilus assembly protein TadD